MIDIRTLENILSDQAEEIASKQQLTFCQRKEEELVDLNSPQAQVIIGVRRSGKSTLCYNVLQRAGVKYAYVNFDDERLATLSVEELNNVLEALYKIYGKFNYLFIDEIQNIPGWYLFVNRLLRQNLHILITGSNAKLLSGELATHLTGRHHAITLYPFSFSEYCELKQIDKQGRSTQAIALRRAAFDDYIRQGGFPELQFLRYDRDYVDTLVDNILKRDIEQRFRITHQASFEHLAQYLMNVAPAIITAKSLADTFAIGSEHTVKNYISYLMQAYLLIELTKYSPKSRLRVTGKKVYPIDVALMNKRRDALVGDNWGWRLESVVFIELLRRSRHNRWNLFYYNERAGECDFLVCCGNEVLQAIQVSYDIQQPRTRKRELAGLQIVARKLRCTNLLLLTDHHYEDVTTEEGNIAIRPVYDWLLES